MVLLLLVLVGEAGSGLIDTVVSERSGASYTSILVLTSYVQLCSLVPLAVRARFCALVIVV